jgi:hypothetical protein
MKYVVHVMRIDQSPHVSLPRLSRIRWCDVQIILTMEVVEQVSRSDALPDANLPLITSDDKQQVREQAG